MFFKDSNFNFIPTLLFKIFSWFLFLYTSSLLPIFYIHHHLLHFCIFCSLGPYYCCPCFPCQPQFTLSIFILFYILCCNLPIFSNVCEPKTSFQNLSLSAQSIFVFVYVSLCIHLLSRVMKFILVLWIPARS